MLKFGNIAMQHFNDNEYHFHSTQERTNPMQYFFKNHVKRSFARIISVLIILQSIYTQPILAEDALPTWQEIGEVTNEASHIETLENTIFVVHKNDKKSGIYFRNDADIDWSTLAINLPEIDAIYNTGSRIYFMGNKNGKTIGYISFSDEVPTISYLKENGTAIWSSFNSNKIESLLVVDNTLTVVVEKLGLFASNDEGNSWNNITTNLPFEPGKTEYDARVIYYHDGNLYVGTKKQGIYLTPYTSLDPANIVYTQIKDAAGLTGSALEIFQIVIDEDETLFIGTKLGVYSTSLAEESSTFVAASGIGEEEVKILRFFDNTLYSATKSTYDLYVYENNQFQVYQTKPTDITIEEIKGITVLNDHIYLAHKKGVIKVLKSAITLTFEETVANIIRSLESAFVLYNGQTALTLQSTYDPYTIEIATSSDEDVLSLDGTIHQKIDATIVDITLRITNSSIPQSALTSTISVTVPGTQSSGQWDGLYSGSYQGYGGLLSLNVIINNDIISSIQITGHSESTDRSDVNKALVQIPSTIVAANSADVDTVSGATVTSNAITQGVRNALSSTDLLSELPESLYERLQYNGNEGSFVQAFNNYIIFGEKIESTKTTAIHIYNNNFELVKSTTYSGFIESTYIEPTTNTLYLIGAKEGAVLLSSTDGLNFTSLPISGLSYEKIESLYVEKTGDQTFICAIMGKYGIYLSYDGGMNFTLSNGNLPVNPEKPAEYDPRTLFAEGDDYYITTKKQGIYLTQDFLNYTALGTLGLTTGALDVWSIAFYDDLVMILGKEGGWYKSQDVEDDWTRLPNLTKEGRLFMEVEGYLFALSKDLTLYQYDLEANTFNMLLEKEGTFIGEDAKSFVYLNDHFVFSDKYGLFKIPFAQSKITGNGVYEGYSSGHEGRISVRVTLENHAIKTVEIVSHSETTSMSTVTYSLNEIPKQMITQQTLEVDSVSGATYTSKGIIQAVKRALKDTSYVSDSDNLDQIWQGPRSSVPSINIAAPVKELLFNLNDQKNSSSVPNVQLSSEMLKKFVEADPYRTEIPVTLTGSLESVKLSFDSDLLQTLETANLPMRIAYEGGSYVIPSNFSFANQLNLPAEKILGIDLQIEKIDEAQALLLQENQSVQLVSPPVEFTLRVHTASGTTLVSDFGDQWIERELLIPDDLDETRLTGVVLENGVWKTVLTKFITRANKRYAVLLRNSNSIYSVVSQESSFDDIQTHWAKTYIEELASKGIIKGNNHLFDPDAKLTRAQYASLIVRLLGLKQNITETTSFIDMNDSDWFSKDVYTAASYGLLTGYQDGTFNPNAFITRDELTVVAMRAYYLLHPDYKNTILDQINTFKDGTYQTATYGYQSDIKIETIIKEGKIVDVNVLSQSETEVFAYVAIPEVVRRIESKQSADVDAVSGATSTTKSIINSVKKALEQADQTSSTGTNPDVESTVDKFLDQDIISSWASQDVMKARKLKMIEGQINNQFNPKGFSTRAEGVTLLNRLYKQLLQ